MPKPRSTSKDNIRIQCQKIIANSVNGDHFGSHETFAAMRHRPDFPVIGPLMADAFTECIQSGCPA
jgi:hypothetical protein